ncbi:MAG: GTPase Era [Mycoplasmatales bacterium]
MFKSGYVAIVGSPNAGKSTILNEVLDAKVAITSDKVGTTRNMIRGIHTDNELQIIFVDTPGINNPQNKLQVYMKNQVEEALHSVDLIVYVLDAKVGIRSKETEIIKKISQNKKTPLIACLNKIDLITQEKALQVITQLQEKAVFQEIIAISAKEGLNVPSFLKTLKNYLPEQAPLYSAEQLTDFSTKFYITEIIREKILRNTFDEIPHGVYVQVNELTLANKKVYIEAIIYVERESQKGIVIGKKAEMVKKIGKYARQDLEDYFGQKIYLDLVVRVDKKWRNKDLEIFEQMTE